MKLKQLLFAGVILMLLVASSNAQSNASPSALRRAAEDYYNWRNQQYPVFSSDAGLHTWDGKLK